MEDGAAVAPAEEGGVERCESEGIDDETKIIFIVVSSSLSQLLRLIEEEQGGREGEQSRWRVD